MPKASGQKLKLISLAKILLESSDEEHPLSVNDMIEKLAVLDISAERKSIYGDLEALTEFGLDILRAQNRYYIGSRTFELPELKLLVDAVQSCRFITGKKSGELIKRLQSLTSVYEAARLSRQVYIANRPKALNEGIYYNIDHLHAAISGNRQISCLYFDWEADFSDGGSLKKRYRHNSARYSISPWALAWEGENYYLIGYDTASAMIKHYRVDKMEDIAITAEPRDGEKIFKNFDIALYTKKMFGMFGGEEERVILRFTNRMLGLVVERFGRDVMLRPDDGGHFRAIVPAVVSPQFLSWLFGLEDEVEILEPQSLRERFVAAAERVVERYKK